MPRLCYLLILLLASATGAAAPTPPKAAVATAHPLATAAGREILQEGGNAFDAAVAVSAALAVVEPYGSGLGGGGFWLLHDASTRREVMIDGRERAPLAAQQDLYLDAQGELIPRASLDGPLAAGIPGTPAALVHIAERYGRLPLARSLAPAIRLAREGFVVGEEYRRLAKFRREVMNEAAARTFLADGAVPPPGWRLRQPQLAAVLERLAARGRAGFYTGEYAEWLVREVRAAGGIWQPRDLTEYRVVEREPVRGRYRGMELVSAAPPSAGGVGLVTMLNILSGYELSDIAPAQRTHLIVEAMRRAYRDRAEYLGDPDYVDLPLDQLLNPLYAAGLAQGIHPRRATPSRLLAPVGAEQPAGADTTHFSILDSAGNRVAATLSINYPFGSGFMPAGTGLLLNNEMDDFASAVGAPNVYGLIGTAPNAIAPGKRPLSSMSPTFVVDGERVAILGTPGGSRIITMVLLGVLSFADGEPPSTWVAHPRFHHQYLPDVIQHEPGALDQQAEALRATGHELKNVGRQYGDMQAILWDQEAGEVTAASDPRGIGRAEVFEVPTAKTSAGGSPAPSLAQ